MSSKPSLRVVKVFDATAMVAGNMIGSGIFLLSGYAAASVGGPGVLLLAWMFGGIMALWGALTTAELATRFPRTGGDFVYLHQSYGPFSAFLYGWMSLVISMSGSIAILALFSSKYVWILAGIQTPSPAGEKLVACGIVILYALLHTLKVTVGSRFQSVLTVVKVLAILLLGTLLLMSPAPAGAVSIDGRGHPGGVLSGFSLALIPIFFTYSGWNVVGYMAGEVHHPRRTLPRALLFGTVVTVVLYLYLNAGFVSILGVDGMRDEALVPMAALRLSRFAGWSGFVNFLIFLSTVSSLSIAVQSGARIYQAMGENGLFFRGAARVHPRFRTPVTSLMVQTGWSAVLILFLPIRSLVDSVTVVMVLFSALTISAVFRARRNERESIPEEGGPFRTPLSRTTPIAYVVSCLFISAGVIRFYLIQGSLLPLWGFLFLVAGAVVFRIWRKGGR
ncbi:MAG: APC family permease [Fidelibacterota bacterium]